VLHIWVSASLLQAGHTILSLKLPLYLTHDHWDLGWSLTILQLPHLASNRPPPFRCLRLFRGEAVPVQRGHTSMPV
jgi:hypothetical protein